MSPGSGVLRRALADERRRLVAGSVLVAIHQAAEATVPVLVGAVIDRAVTTGDGGSLGRWLVALAVLFLGLSFAWRFGDRHLTWAAQNTDHELRVDLTAKVLDPRGSEAGERFAGELLNVATSDTERSGEIHFVVGIGVGAVTAIAYAAVVLLGVSVPLGLLVLLGLPPMLVLLQVLSRPLEKRSGTEQEAAAAASAVAADVLHGLRVVKGIGAESAAAERYRTASQASLHATVRAAAYEGAHRGFTVSLTGAFLALVALVAGRLAAEGTITVGEAVAAIGLTQFLLGPLLRLSWSLATIAKARASARRVEEVCDAAPKLAGTGARPTGDGALAFRDVTAPGLVGATFEVAPGELVGIVAEPLAARSIVDLLALERRPEGGTVELDGTDLGVGDPDAVRAALLVAAHDADLFEGTLTANVGVRAASAWHLHAAVEAAAVADVIESLPQGADSQLPARGLSLSGGQRQRVALGRALAVDAPALVLHEPTTAVDAVTERQIADALRLLRRDRTTVVVSTSATLLSVADRILLLEGGRVVAVGTHDELVADVRYRSAVLA